MFIDLIKGFKKVPIVGFSFPYHKPANNKCCLLNLNNYNVLLNYMKITFKITNLKDGGNSFIATHIGHIEVFDDL